MLPWLSAGCTLCFPCPHEVLLRLAKLPFTLHVMSIVALGFVLYVLRSVQPMTGVSSSFLCTRIVEMRSQQVSCSLLPLYVPAALAASCTFSGMAHGFLFSKLAFYFEKFFLIFG
jgi:hypothetical protein